MKTVTRVEIAEQLDGLFDDDHVAGSDGLVSFAAEHGARDEVLLVLGRLRGKKYRTLSDLWSELGDIPVEL